MAPRINPSKGGKPDKLFRDAVMVAVKRDCIDPDSGINTTKLNRLAAKVVDLAIDGNIPAAVMIRDSIDGKPTQDIEIEHTGEVTLRSVIVSELNSFFSQTAGRLEDRSDADVVSN